MLAWDQVPGPAFGGHPRAEGVGVHGRLLVACSVALGVSDVAGTPVAGDVGDEASLRAALEGCEVAYYLVHSLGDPGFQRKDADAARAFARAAAAGGVDRIVYLGGLGRDGDRLSRHLRSRREVERLLGGTGLPVTVLRAGIVVGHGAVSWEMTPLQGIQAVHERMGRRLAAGG